MYIDSRELKPNQVVRTDICIIGAGAAGITLAREFTNKPFRVCLLESGGFLMDQETHNLTQAINIGRKYSILNQSRLRYFGGTTKHWGGHCVPIRPLNFEQRPWIPYSGWPFGRKELDPYYKRAHKVLQLGDFSYDPIVMANTLGMQLFPFDQTKVESVVSRYNAVRFGSSFRDNLRQATNITIYLYANVTSINQYPHKPFIHDVSVKTLGGKAFSVHAKYYILATGGIENARLLLLSNQIQKAGLGNQHDLVGRFFMEHIFYPTAKILPADQTRPLNIYGAQHPYGETYRIRCHLALPEDVIRQQQIPDFRAELHISNTNRIHKAISSAKALKDWEWPENLGTHLLNIIKDPNTIVRKLTTEERPLVYTLLNFVEQVPNPDSRIGLSEEKDTLGLNKATLDWRLSGLDKEGIAKATHLIAAEVGRSGFGRMRIQPFRDKEVLLEGARGGTITWAPRECTPIPDGVSLMLIARYMGLTISLSQDPRCSRLAGIPTQH